MIKYYALDTGVNSLDTVSKIESGKIIWIDLINSNDEEKDFIEKTFDVELFTKEEIEEIESSSKYIETENEIGININFIRTDTEMINKEPVSVIIKDKLLVTQREYNFRAFEDTYKKLEQHRVKDGDDIYLLLLDTRIDYDADLIEGITEKISVINKELHSGKEHRKETLLKIASLQSKIILIRENIVEKQRILSAMMKSKMFPKEDYEIMTVMLSDINSILDHTNFNFERLEYLQNTFLGLVNMEQNRVIKLFTVLTVIFMPPTLIASMYGMNFKYMPELSQPWGYPMAIAMMFGSSLITLLFFKSRKWI
ncbi:MAG: magnesium/cobalt transporter CorA [Deltaproteobacteria bacterium]